MKENIEKLDIRQGIVYHEEEEEEEESYSNDYYCNNKFFEKNPKMVGENNDIFKSYVESVKDDEKSKEIEIPYGMYGKYMNCSNIFLLFYIIYMI